MLLGYDVSAHNDPASVPWHLAAFGAVRVSHGKGADKRAAAHFARMSDAERIGYHFLRGDSPGYEQADAFWDLVCDLGGGTSFGLAVDLEHLNPPAAPWDRKVYRYRYLDFLKRLRELSGRPCLTYSYKHFVEWLALTPAEIGDSPLWLSDINGPVEVPKPWADWTIHQYSYKSPDGADLDHNTFRGSREDLRRVLGLVPSAVDVNLGALAGAVRAAEGRGKSVEDFVSVPEEPRIEG